MIEARRQVIGVDRDGKPSSDEPRRVEREARGLVIEDLTLRFGGLVALDHFSAGVSEGELVGLVGPNGAGKTCVINCVTGLYRPNSGTIRLRGVELAGAAPHKIVASGVARTFQQVHLVPEMTVEENLLTARNHLLSRWFPWSLLYYGPARRDDEAQLAAISQTLAFANITHLRHRDVAELTMWEQKLTSIARALCSEPTVLLLDEPAAGLAPSEKRDLAALIRTIQRERGILQLAVEHDMEFLSELCDRIVVMNAGTKLAEGPPQSVLQQPEVVEAYLGVG